MDRAWKLSSGLPAAAAAIAAGGAAALLSEVSFKKALVSPSSSPFCSMSKGCILESLASSLLL